MYWGCCTWKKTGRTITESQEGNRIRKIVLGAKSYASKSGTLTGEFANEIKKLLNPEAPWERLLAEMV